MNIAQRLCPGCPRMSGYTLDPTSGMWVCGECGLPSETYYLALRSAQPPGVPITYAPGRKAISQRSRARQQN
jgi:hypothetical protein